MHNNVNLSFLVTFQCPVHPLITCLCLYKLNIIISQFVIAFVTCTYSKWPSFMGMHCCKFNENVFLTIEYFK